MSALSTSLYATAALVAGPWLFYTGFRTMNTRRLIANTPTARMRSMAMGLVEVCGTVEPRSTATAPFSGKACAYWEIDIATHNRRGWTIVHRDRSGNPFFLRDDTGVALVYPSGSESKLPFGSEEHYLGLALPECYADYMNAHTSALGQIMRVGNLRFRERMLEGGEHVFVLGTATPRSQERTISEIELPEEAADPAAARLRTLDHEVTGVIRRGENVPTFIISQESEKSLMLDLGARAFLQLAGGPALTLIGAIYWLAAMSTGRMPW